MTASFVKLHSLSGDNGSPIMAFGSVKGTDHEKIKPKEIKIK